MAGISHYLQRHTKALVKDVGIEVARSATCKSKVALGRYYSGNLEHADRFMPINSATWFEDTASFPHVTMALAELCGAAILMDDRLRNETNKGGVNTDVIALSHRFALLMSEYHQSIQDGISTVNERK